MRRIVIPGIPPSLNEMKRMHVQRQSREKKQWHGLVAMCVTRQLGNVDPYRKARCTYTYFFPNRNRRDPSNYTPKWIEDGLVQAGVLEDDSFDHVEIFIKKGGVDKHDPRVEVEIIPVKGEGA